MTRAMSATTVALYPRRRDVMQAARLWRILAVASVGLIVVACRCPVDFSTKKPGARLLGHLSSFSSFEEISGRVLSEQHFVLVHKTTCRRSDPRPCFQVTVRKTEFKNLGVEGELWLTFFNDRLYGAMFYPADFDRYLRQLAHSGLALPRSSEPLELSSNTLVWSGLSEQKRPFVAWVDRRLLDEHAKWIRCYGELGDGKGAAPIQPIATSR